MYLLQVMFEGRYSSYDRVVFDNNNYIQKVYSIDSWIIGDLIFLVFKFCILEYSFCFASASWVSCEVFIVYSASKEVWENYTNVMQDKTPLVVQVME